MKFEGRREGGQGERHIQAICIFSASLQQGRFSSLRACINIRGLRVQGHLRDQSVSVSTRNRPEVVQHAWMQSSAALLEQSNNGVLEVFQSHDSSTHHSFMWRCRQRLPIFKSISLSRLRVRRFYA